MPIRQPRTKERVPASQPLVEPDTVEQAEEPKIPIKVTALVVSCNRVDRLRRAIEALEASEARETLEILVVDNGSRDGSGQVEADYPNTRFIRIPKNFGLTKALNIGLRSAEGDYVFLLHEDTEVFADTVRVLAAVLDQEADAAAVAPLLVNAEGNPAPQLGDLPPNGVFEPAETRTEPYQVGYATGAALMARKFFLRGMGQIDEHYGNFGSDAEIAYQVRRGGKKTLLVPGVRAIHHGGRPRTALREADFRTGVAVFVGKHRGLVNGIGARVGNVLGALFGMRLGEFKYLISGQKIDGTQAE